jgi:type IV pilus assembly protein PilC
LVPHLLGIGEKTGAVDKVCHELGTYFDGDLRLRLRRMMALFEPAVIVVIGGVVGFVYFAFFQAVFALV